MWLFNYFNLETNYDVLKSKSPCILLNKNINFNKNETESKMEIPHTVLDQRTLCFSSHSNCKLKVKLWWDGACKRKKEGIFCTIYFVWRKFFNISVLSQCIVYWIHFQNIHTFTYQKTLLHTFLQLVFSIGESLQCILTEKEIFSKILYYHALNVTLEYWK